MAHRSRKTTNILFILLFSWLTIDGLLGNPPFIYALGFKSFNHDVNVSSLTKELTISISALFDNKALDI